MLVAVALAPLLLLTLSQPPSCADVSSCRQAALEAAGRNDFEAFHDLAWRAAQRGRPNDPELMYLLARAQSLSGRPGDALVMLRRLAQLGIATDARDNADFERVRQLAGWADLEALLAGTPVTHPPLTAASTPAATSTPAAAPPAASAAKPKPAAAETRKPDAPSYVDTPGGRRGADAGLRLPSSSDNPIGLAYDSASRRFVVGDGDGDKLLIADEVFDHVNDLIGASSGGFGDLGAVEIDTRRGDLWAISSDGKGGGAVHKLQLVSGRVLSRIEVPSTLQPVVLGDFTVTDDAALVVLDSQGSRLLRVRASDSQFERPIALKVTAPSSIAPTGNGTIYVAHEDGVSLVDMASGRVSTVQPATGVSLVSLRRIRWTRGALLGIQGQGASSRLVKIRLNGSGQRAMAAQILDGDRRSLGTALTISRDAAYYVAGSPEGPEIRKVELR